MCHSSDRWTYWSRRQRQTAEEPPTRSPAASAPADAAARKPAVERHEDEPIRQEKELEPLP